jgi:hypothetical protein
MVAENPVMGQYLQDLGQFCADHGSQISALKVVNTHRHPVEWGHMYNVRYNAHQHVVLNTSSVWQNLPCANLQQLQLGEFNVQLGNSSDRQGIFDAYTGLTHLSLQHCSISDTPEALAALPALSALRHLDLHASVGRPQMIMTITATPGCVLSQTLQLTHLRLAGPVVDDTLSHLSRCSLLQHLVLDLGDRASDWHITAPVLQEGLQHLTALTHLAMHCVKDAQLRPQEDLLPEPPFITSSSIPSLSRLTALKSLAVQSASAFDPAVLQDMTRLTSLAVVSTPLVGGPAALLAVLPRLKCILRLDVAKSFRCACVCKEAEGKRRAQAHEVDDTEQIQ